MLRRVTLSLVLTLFVVTSVLLLGTAAPKSAPARSPYVSALANYGVGTAEAASHKCTNTGCLVLQGIQSCRGGEYPGTNCVMVSGACQVTACR
jgi:L-asparagine transporter-like permease